MTWLDIPNPHGTPTFGDHLCCPCVGLNGQAAGGEGSGDGGNEGAGLRPDSAAVTGAPTAVRTGRAPTVLARQNRSWDRVRVPAEIAGSSLESFAEGKGTQWGERVGLGAPSLERVAGVAVRLVADIGGNAGHAQQPLPARIVRLQVIVGNGPVRKGGACWKGAPAVPLDGPSSGDKVSRKEPARPPAVVHRGATHAVHHLTDCGKRGLGGKAWSLSPYGSFPVELRAQKVSVLSSPQFVGHEVGVCVKGARFNAGHLKAGVRQDHGRNRPGSPQTDNHGVCLGRSLAQSRSGIGGLTMRSTMVRACPGCGGPDPRDSASSWRPT